MREIFEATIATLKANSGVTTLVKPGNISAGPLDVVMEKQTDLRYPSIITTQVSEVSRSVPQVRDTNLQVDIWSRTSQLELENIYEAVLSALNYQSGDQGTAHIFWQRLGGAVDVLETDRRTWHRSCTFVFWSIKS